MSWDLDTVLSVALAGDDEPRLFELGRAFRRGKPEATTFAWSNGRILAARGTDWFRLKRRFGVVGPGVTITTDELCALAGVCEHWARERDRWAAFYYSSAGYPPGYGGACYYRSPGARGKRVTIGVSVLGRRRGRDLEGRDEIRKPARAQRLPCGAALVGEIWRRGERYGPRAGSLVGLRYVVGADLRVEARREELSVSRGSNEGLSIEPGEEAFVLALRELP